MIPSTKPLRIVGDLLFYWQSRGPQATVITVRRDAVRFVEIQLTDEARFVIRFTVSPPDHPNGCAIGFSVTPTVLERFLRWLEPCMPPLALLGVEDDTAFETAHATWLKDQA